MWDPAIWISFLTNLWLESSLHFSHFHICNLCPIYALGPIFKLFMLIWGVIVSVFWHWIVFFFCCCCWFFFVFFFFYLFVWFFCFCVFNCKIGIPSIVDIVTLLLNNHQNKYCTQLLLYIRNKIPFQRHQWSLFSTIYTKRVLKTLANIHIFVVVIHWTNLGAYP